jgi:hypothetical protein
MFVSLAGCGSAITGTAAEQPYQPLPIATASAHQQQVVDGALALSTDLKSALVRGDSAAACLIGTDAPDAVKACAVLPDGVRGVRAVFSPDGARYAVFEDFYRSFSGRVWIVDSATGGTREVRVDTGPPDPSGASGGTSSHGTSPHGTSSPVTRPSAGSSSTTSTGGRTAPEAAIIGVFWRSDVELVGVGLTSIFRIDAGAGAPTAKVLAVVGSRQQPIQWAFSHRAMAVMKGTTAVTVALDSGTVTDPAATVGGQGNTRPTLLGVSEDGSRLLVSASNLQTLRPGPTTVYGVNDKKATVIQQPDDTYTFAGAFSPDGSEVVLISRAGGFNSGSSSGAEVQLVPATGGKPRTIGTVDQPPFGPLSWSRNDVLMDTAPYSTARQVWKLTG